MPSPWSAWTPRISRFLGRVHDRTDITDISLAAYIMERSEESLDRSTLTHVRAGRVQAPLALLYALLEHASEDEKLIIAQALLEPFGLKVSRREEKASEALGVVALVLKVSGCGGQVAEWLRASLADDGEIDASEWFAAEGLADQLVTAAEKLRTMAARHQKKVA